MSPLASIERQLQQRFAKVSEVGRLVVWSDPESEYAESVDSLAALDSLIADFEKMCSKRHKEGIRQHFFAETLPEASSSDFQASVASPPGI